MPAHRNRTSVRTSASSARSTRSIPKESAKLEKVITEELAIETEETDVRVTAAKGRRGSSARHSSRTSAVVSGESSRVSARRPATPEQVAGRRQVIRSALLVAVGVALTIVLVAVLVLVVFKKDPLAEKVASTLATVQSSLPAIASRQAFEEAKALLATVPDAPAFAERKADLAKELTKLEEKVAHSDREVRVVEQRKQLLEQIAKLTDPATDLDKLAADCQAFIKNPVDANAVPDPQLVAQFANAINDIQARLPSIEGERTRRLAGATTTVVQRVQLEVEALLKEEKFSEATKVIDDNAEKFPKANFSRVRTYLNDSASSAWTNIQSYVENRYKDYASPGVTQAARQKALEDVRARLDQVINNWGIEAYVTQARELRAKY
jgi:hypothetical protein